MVMNDGMLRVFWPYEIARSSEPGVIVGWRISEFDVFVVSILEHVEARSVENALRMNILYRNSPHPIARIFGLCGKPAMHVLGTVNPPEIPTAFSPSHIYAITSPSTKVPRIYCPPEMKLPLQVIMFHRPHPTKMQYMSLRPIPLALGDKHTMFDKADEALDDIEMAEKEARARSSRLMAKRKLHTVVKHVPSSKEQALPVVLNQINCSFEMDRLLQNNIGLIGTRPKRTLSVSERVVESATTAWGVILWALTYVLMVWIYPVVTRGFIGVLIGHRVIAEVALKILEWRAAPDAAALKDISATAQQIDIRLQQFCYWPIQYLTLRKRKDDWESVTNSHPDYIRFYNSLWLVANDVIIGIALGSYIIDNANVVATQINAVLSGWTVEALQQTISWLMGWPAGLKLNNELAVFLGDLFLWIIAHWARALASLQPFLRLVVYMVGCASFAGASMAIAMFSDLLSIFTVHIYCFYIASARIFNWQLTIITSLFHLFRGKKRNILRNRIDSCDYELDQLLLGTILFTLLFFLLPTVLVFYITFASARMTIISLKAYLDTCLAVLNHFPLFALMLRMKDSGRLPGGIYFELRKPNLPKASSNNIHYTETSYIHLQSIPLSLREMFDQYFRLGHRLRQHYLSPRVILCLATGQFIPPIHRRNLYSLQYSMLPARRVGIIDVWSRLTAKHNSPGFGGGGMGNHAGVGGFGGGGTYRGATFPHSQVHEGLLGIKPQIVKKMHGMWTEEQDVAIVALRLGTNFGWTKIETEFNLLFPAATATRKDLESRFNKTLKPELALPSGGRQGQIAEVIDEYRHEMQTQFTDNTKRDWVLRALAVLRRFPNDRLIPVAPALENANNLGPVNQPLPVLQAPPVNDQPQIATPAVLGQSDVIVQAPLEVANDEAVQDEQRPPQGWVSHEQWETEYRSIIGTTNDTVSQEIFSPAEEGVPGDNITQGQQPQQGHYPSPSISGYGNIDPRLFGTDHFRTMQ
ncbi:phosphatidylinositol N-acetylglucosaminyltransferase subunit gpi1 [Myotisia sp. PD_48]|nr:phosphatidylinositol N-acetylglucosaminyltransferase subunit gpi1 [Myotisia sp. PD_48]